MRAQGGSNRPSDERTSSRGVLDGGRARPLDVGRGGGGGGGTARFGPGLPPPPLTVGRRPPEGGGGAKAKRWFITGSHTPPPAPRGHPQSSADTNRNGRQSTVLHRRSTAALPCEASRRSAAGRRPPQSRGRREGPCGTARGVPRAGARDGRPRGCPPAAASDGDAVHEDHPLARGQDLHGDRLHGRPLERRHRRRAPVRHRQTAARRGPSRGLDRDPEHRGGQTGAEAERARLRVDGGQLQAQQAPEARPGDGGQRRAQHRDGGLGPARAHAPGPAGAREQDDDADRHEERQEDADGPEGELGAGEAEEHQEAPSNKADAGPDVRAPVQQSEAAEVLLGAGVGGVQHLLHLLECQGPAHFRDGAAEVLGVRPFQDGHGVVDEGDGHLVGAAEADAPHVGGLWRLGLNDVVAHVLGDG